MGCILRDHFFLSAGRADYLESVWVSVWFIIRPYGCVHEYWVLKERKKRSRETEFGSEHRLGWLWGQNPRGQLRYISDKQPIWRSLCFRRLAHHLGFASTRSGGIMELSSKTVLVLLGHRRHITTSTEFTKKKTPYHFTHSTPIAASSEHTPLRTTFKAPLTLTCFTLTPTHYRLLTSTVFVDTMGNSKGAKKLE